MRRRCGKVTTAAVLAAALGLGVLGAGLAGAVGEVAQKPGTNGCMAFESMDGCQAGRGLRGATRVAISPDGKNVYVVSVLSNAVAIFDRNRTTGELTQRPGMAACIAEKEPQVEEGCELGRGLNKPADVTVSPDGRTVYVASETSGAVAIFGRDPATGALTQKPGLDGCISHDGGEGCREVPAVAGAKGVAVGPEGRTVYVLGGSEGADVAILDRDPSTGGLSPREGKAGCISKLAVTCQAGRGFEIVEALAISPDGRSLYVTSSVGRLVAVLKRNPMTGALEQAGDASGCISPTPPMSAEPCQPGRGMNSPEGIAISPDGKTVYVASKVPGQLAIFERQANGVLTQKPGSQGCISATGSDSVGGSCQTDPVLGGVENVAVSADGRSVYAVGFTSGLSVFERHENGTLEPLPTPSGCITETGSNGACQDGRGLLGAEGVAVSPDEKSIYVAGFNGALTIFDRVARDTVAPAISAFRLAPSRFKSKPAGHGSAFRFKLSEPAKVTIAVERQRGRRKFSRALTMRKTVGRTGAIRLGFSGRGKKRALATGTYRATIVATDAEGNASKPRRARFTILAPRPRRR